MSKEGLRGRAGAHKVILVAAIAFILRKFTNFEPVKVKIMDIKLQMEQPPLLQV